MGQSNQNETYLEMRGYNAGKNQKLKTISSELKTKIELTQKWINRTDIASEEI